MGIKSVNDINDINESMKISKRNLNESMINDRTLKVQNTDYIADKLTKIYNAPQSRDFFLKCAWHLSEDTIWTAVENSQRKSVKSPVKYFIAICNRELQHMAI